MKTQHCNSQTETPSSSSPAPANGTRRGRRRHLRLPAFGRGLRRALPGLPFMHRPRPSNPRRRLWNRPGNAPSLPPKSRILLFPLLMIIFCTFADSELPAEPARAQVPPGGPLLAPRLRPAPSLRRTPP